MTALAHPSPPTLRYKQMPYFTDKEVEQYQGAVSLPHFGDLFLSL